MNYNILGKTGEKVSLLGFGAMRIPLVEINGRWYADEDKALPLLRRAHDLGVNYFDTAPFYCEDNSEIALGKGLKDFRKDVLIATKTPLGGQNVQNESDFFRRLETSLARLQTGYIDVYQIWSFGKAAYDRMFIEKGIGRALTMAKEQGLIRHICFSFHGNPDDVKYILDSTDLFESILINSNIYDRSREEAIKYAAAKGLGLINMGALCIAGLAEIPQFRESATQRGYDPYEIALKFVLQNKNFHAVLSSIKNEQVLEKTVAFVNQNEPLTEEEWVIIHSVEQMPRKVLTN
jgi:predicted aldo/keto reductase-like oxidoreductase